MKKINAFAVLIAFGMACSLTAVSAMETYAVNYMSWEGWGIIGKYSDASFSTNSGREVHVVNTITRADNPYKINATATLVKKNWWGNQDVYILSQDSLGTKSFKYVVSDATYLMKFDSYTNNGAQNGLDISGYIE